MSYEKLYFESKFESRYEEEGCAWPRMGHVGQIYAGRYLIVWGGHQHYELRNEKGLESSHVWIFNSEIEKWKCMECADPPPLLSGAASVIKDHSLYIFGGSKRPTFAGYTEWYYNDLYRLCLKELKWEKCEPLGGKMPSPRDKMSAWASDNKLYFFGGFGPCFKNTYLDSYGEFRQITNYTQRLGWNNQLIIYDTVSNTWHNQKYSGKNEVPAPRAAHTCTKLDDNCILLFGGRTLEQRANDLYLLNLNDFSWSLNLNENKSKENLPSERSWHTMTKLDKSNLFLFGGLSQGNDSLGDGWILNLKNFEWTKIGIDFEKRLWHSTSISEKNKQIYVFGGSLTDVYLNKPKYPEHMLKISLSPGSLKSKCIHYITENLELFEPRLNKQQLPFELEQSIYLKFLTSPKLVEENQQRKLVSRSEYCSLQ